MSSLQYVAIVKFLPICKLLTNVYKMGLFYCFVNVQSPGGKTGILVCTIRLNCKQRYNKTQVEIEMNFLIHAYCFALMGPGFLLMGSGGMDTTT